MRKTSLFSMCSLYPGDEEAVCPCFLGKGEDVAAEMEALESDGILWAAMGSGVVSLEDLALEIAGGRPWDPAGPSDREFLVACQRRGILVFAVVFTAQGYEIEVERDARGRVASWGRTTGRGRPERWGLSRFYAGAAAERFVEARDLASIREAGDFVEAAACRDIEGRPSRCHWVDSTGRADGLAYTSYFMCRSNPLWIRHLERIVEMQVEAGADGIQFDEPGLPLDVAGTRAGFCRACRDGFRRHLEEKIGRSLGDFDYATTLREAGAGIVSELAYFRGLPFWKEFRVWRLREVVRTFSRLADHARACGRRRGREVLVAANFFDVFPHFFPLAPHVDVFSMEITPGIPPGRTGLTFYEVARALAGEKPVTAVPEIAFASFLRERGRKGLDRNLMRYLIAEAAAADASFMVPHGCLTIAGVGPYNPPAEAIVPWRAFLAEHGEALDGAEPVAEVEVVLSFPSYLWTFDFLTAFPGPHFESFDRTLGCLRRRGMQYRIAIWGDGEIVPEGPAGPERARVWVLPHVVCATDAQIGAVDSFVRHGGTAIVLGDFGSHDSSYDRRARAPFDGLRRGENALGKGRVVRIDTIHEGEMQAVLARLGGPVFDSGSATGSVIVKAYAKGEGVILHLLDTGYDLERDAFQEVSGLEVEGPGLGDMVFLTPGESPRGIRSGRGRMAVPPFRIHGVLVPA